MNRLQALNRLDFYYQRIINEQIKAKSVTKLEAFVFQRNSHLSLYRHLAQSQLPLKRQFVGRFKQTWSEYAMNLYRRSNHRTGQFRNRDDPGIHGLYVGRIGDPRRI